MICPTAAGKSKMAATVMRWLAAKSEASTWVVPTNALLVQIEKEFAPRVHCVKAKKLHLCNKYWDSHGNAKNCDEVTKKECKEAMCGPRCPYIASIVKMKTSLMQAMNTHMLYASGKMGKPTSHIILDEGHNIVPFLRGISVKRFWAHDWGFPSESTHSYALLLEWCNSTLKLISAHAQTPDSKRQLKKLTSLRDELRTVEGRYILRREMLDWHGTPRLCVTMLPIDIKEAYQSLFHKQGKTILMSATLSLETIKELGLSGKRVSIITSPSPIPVERRKVIFVPLVSNSFASLGKDFALLCSSLQVILDRHQGVKGMVHTTYEQAKKLQEVFADTSRLVFHDKHNKSTVFADWCEKEDDRVLVGAGMTEGLDLIDSLCRFQIIAKIAWPSLYDPVIAEKARRDPSWYRWVAALSVMQAAGRTCRTPEDFGVTYAIDKSFEQLEDQLLDWFKDSIERRESL
jgi:hypothetical protein